MTPVGTAAAAPSTPARSRSRDGLLRAGRILLFVAGLGLVAWLVRSAGVAQVLGVLRGAGAWLPVVALLEVAFVTSDVISSRVLLGPAARAVSASVWVRASALAYASTVLLPAGRAAGEATRATVLAPAVGLGRAAGACARLQACVLMGNAFLSLGIAATVAMRGAGTTPLALALLGNAAACAVFGSVLLALLRSGRMASWLRRRFPRFAQAHAPTEHVPARRGAPLIAVGLAILGRLAQTGQYALVLFAVGGAVSPASALTAQGIQLVGAAVGDVIPGQVGAAEGAYRAFAGTLGLAADPARALSIALLVRLAQLGLAATCLIVATLLRGRRAPVETPGS